MTPITPQTDPNFFYTRAINGHEYFVPNFIVYEIKKLIDDATREAYRRAKPEECKSDIDYTKFNAWIDTEDGTILSNDAIAKVLFIPKNGAPPVDFQRMPLAYFNEAYHFFDRKLPASRFAPTDVTASSESQQAKPESSAATPAA